jgi:flavin-binding protein dodecin
LADSGLQILIERSAEQDTTHDLQEAVAAAADAERLTDWARVAVRRDHVVRPKHVRVSVAMA